MLYSRFAPNLKINVNKCLHIKNTLLIFVYIIKNIEIMKASKWYLVQGQTQFGNYALIKEEETDLIVAEFPAVDHHTANERAINLNSIVDEHNTVVKLLKKQSV